MAKIVDSSGRLFADDVLSEQQTSQLVSLHRSVAGHPARGITPARLNQILEAAENGDLIAQHELFRDMEERDGHIFAELSKRKRSVIKLEWDIVPPRNASREEEKLTAYAKELIQDMSDFEDLQFDALDAISHGFSALELEWHRVGQDWSIKQAHNRPQSWFDLDTDTRTQLRLRDHTPGGAELRPFGWLMHIHKSMTGYVTRAGISRVLVWPYIFKHFSVGDLAEFLDIYGLPLRVGKYPANATAAEKATLWRAVAGIGHNAAGIIPNAMAIEFEEAAAGSDKPFLAMIEWCEKTQSKAITGSTLGMDTGRGGIGEGLSKIQNEIRLDIRDSDCKQLAGSLTRHLIYPLLAINKGWSDIRRCPRIVYDTAESDDIKIYADSLPKLVGIGLKIKNDWVHDKLRIPHAAAGDDVLAIPDKTDQPAAKDKKTALAALSAVFSDQAAIDGALGEMDAELYTLAKTWLKPALAALADAKDAEAALAILASDNPLVDDKVLLDAIAQAIFVSELIGSDSALKDLQ
jgi:phage gp29-like protein